MLTDKQFIRFSRQIMLPEVGEAGQQRLAQLRVLQIGVGGLGCSAAQALLSAGVGQLVLADDDQVDDSNLPRQLLYRDADVGRDKATVAATFLHQLAPDALIRPISRRVTAEILALEVPLADLVLDCSDNVQTRQAVNAACVQVAKPLVSAAAIGWQGLLMSFLPQQGCYHCLFPDTGNSPQNCQTQGVIGPLPAMLGHWQALEALRIMLAEKAAGTLNLRPQLVKINAWQGQWQVLYPAADPACVVCGATAI
ncbi:MAG: HesA/MoeB/ThiF family protein [Plesiomonas sp.]